MDNRIIYKNFERDEQNIEVKFEVKRKGWTDIEIKMTCQGEEITVIVRPNINDNSERILIYNDNLAHTINGDIIINTLEDINDKFFDALIEIYFKQ